MTLRAGSDLAGILVGTATPLLGHRAGFHSGKYPIR